MRSATTAASKETWSEDWLSVIIGVLVFALAPAAKTYAGLDGVTALFLTYASLLVVLSAGVAALGADRFALSFTVVFAIAYASWIAGSYAYIAAVTPAEQLQDPE